MRKLLPVALGLSLFAVFLGIHLRGEKSTASVPKSAPVSVEENRRVAELHDLQTLGAPLTVDGQPVRTWEDVLKTLETSGADTLQITVRRTTLRDVDQEVRITLKRIPIEGDVPVEPMLKFSRAPARSTRSTWTHRDYMLVGEEPVRPTIME